MFGVINEIYENVVIFEVSFVMLGVELDIIDELFQWGILFYVFVLLFSGDDFVQFDLGIEIVVEYIIVLNLIVSGLVK